MLALSHGFLTDRRVRSWGLGKRIGGSLIKEKRKTKRKRKKGGSKRKKGRKWRRKKRRKKRERRSKRKRQRQRVRSGDDSAGERTTGKDERRNVKARMRETKKKKTLVRMFDEIRLIDSFNMVVDIMTSAHLLNNSKSQVSFFDILITTG